MRKNAWFMLLLLPVPMILAGLAPAVANDDTALLDEFRSRRSAITGEDASALCRLGLWCREKGLSEQARRVFADAIAADPENRLARRALGFEKVGDTWLRGDALRKARGFVLLDGRWVLREEAIAHEAQRREKLLRDEKTRGDRERAARLVRSLGSARDEGRRQAAETLGAMPIEISFRPLVAALNSAGPADMRRGAIEVLARHEPEQILRPLVRASITDPEPAVRKAAVDAVRGFKLPGILAPYVTALTSTRSDVRHNAIDAIGKLGDIQGIGVLIRFWEQRGGGFLRAHIYFGTQTAFIQDFDVEVAQTAFIADPIVGTLQDGSVLEVQVGGTARFFTTVERQIIRRSLKALAGVDHGSDVKAWVSWSARNGTHRSAAPADLEPTGDR